MFTCLLAQCGYTQYMNDYTEAQRPDNPIDEINSENWGAVERENEREEEEHND